tara:strand:- start:2659 stop:3102 length:444 start_codon:yes stop_codon:yes gene_type:complete
MATRPLLKDKEMEDEKHQCPLSTRDVLVNLKQRNWAFKNVGYGPANPLDEKNNKAFWLKKSITWNTTEIEAKGMRCGNCAAFIQTSQMIDCIKKGIEAKDPRMEAGYDDEVVEAAQLGYCELFHFKCAAIRVCDSWLVGGPITDSKD